MLMQEYQNYRPLNRTDVEDVLKEEREARRPQRCCKNVSKSVVYATLMAGIAYLIFDNYNLRKEIKKSTCPSNPRCLSPVTTNCPSSPSTNVIDTALYTWLKLFMAEAYQDER